MPRKQRQVMWPRLIASKLFEKRSGTTNFLADFPTNGGILVEIPPLEQEYLSPKIFSNKFLETLDYKVFVSTWNVGGVSPPDTLNVEDLLDTRNTLCDIYVLGFQEVVPLQASNVLGPENRRVAMRWNSLIREALNKKAWSSRERIEVADQDKQINLSTTKDGHSSESRGAIPQEFRCIVCKQMVGILISVWVRCDLLPYIRNPSVSCVGCGLLGCLGNKGAVSVRFRLHETRLCFVCSHLASGGREGDERYRNSNVAAVLLRTRFAKGPSLDLPRKILDHDRIILLGDLNYRISLPTSETRALVDRADWDGLLENDQLRMELKDGKVFEGWQEGTIKFAPTYKYYPNSDEYLGGVHGKKDKKKRAPAWCDRIIWFGEGIKQHLYTRGESRLSDHRPVKAIFTTEVEVSRRLNRLQSFFFPEKFVPIASRLEFSNKGRSSF